MAEECASCCFEGCVRGIAHCLMDICCQMCCNLMCNCCDNGDKPDDPNSRTRSQALGRGPIYRSFQDLGLQLRNDDSDRVSMTDVYHVNNAHQPNQTTDVWNISGRVSHDSGAITSERWPTHDHHINMNSYAFPDSVASPLKDRLPPPPYTEVDLPSYEQATGIPKPKTDLVNVHITPLRNSTPNTPGTSS